MSLIDEIKIKSLSDAQEILKAAGSEDIFEKAHKDGDLHPNGKWVWVSSAAGGKGDWRTLNGRIHKKHQAESGGSSTGVSSASSSSRKVNSSQTNVKIRTDLPKIEYGGNAKKDAAAIARAGDVLKKEGFTLGDDNLYHHKDGRVVRINTKTGYFEETTRNANSDKNVTGQKSSVKNEDKSSKSNKTSKTETYSHDINGVSVNVSKNKDGSYTLEANGKKVKSDDPSFFKDKLTPRVKKALAKEVGIEVSAVKKQASKGISEKTLSDALIKECSKDIEQSRKEVIDYGYSSFNREINFNGKKQTIYVKLYRKDNIGRNKSYEISVGTEFGNIKKISEPTYIGSNDIKVAIKSYFSEKVNSIHIVDMQQSVRDKNSLLKQLKSSKSNKVLIHYHSTSGFDINKMRSIAEKEGWKITDKSVDKNGNHTYNVNSYIMFEKQTKK